MPSAEYSQRTVYWCPFLCIAIFALLDCHQFCYLLAHRPQLPLVVIILVRQIIIVFIFINVVVIVIVTSPRGVIVVVSVIDY